MQTDHTDQSLTPTRSDAGAKRTVVSEEDRSDIAQGNSVNEITGNELPKEPAKAKRFYTMTPKRQAAVQRMQEGRKRSLDEKRKQTSEVAAKLRMASKSSTLKRDQAEPKVMMVDDPEMEQIERDHPAVTKDMREGVEVTVHEKMDRNMPKSFQEKLESKGRDLSTEELLKILERYHELANLNLQSIKLAKSSSSKRKKRRAKYESDSDGSDGDDEDSEDYDSEDEAPRRRKRAKKKKPKAASGGSRQVSTEQLQNTAGRKAEMYSAAIRQFGSNSIYGLKWQTN